MLEEVVKKYLNEFVWLVMVIDLKWISLVEEEERKI